MHQPFTYLIKHKPSGKVYYGVRYAKKCSPKDLWKTYFTSSEDIRMLIESDGKDAFEFQIRKIFNDAKKAIEWEKRVLKRMKVIKREDFINRNIPGSSMFSHSEETKKKMRKPKPIGFSEKLKGNKHASNTKGILKTKEHAENISKGKKGKAPFKGEDHPRYGTKKTNDELLKLSLSMKKKKWMNNGVNCAFVEPTEIDIYLARGYTMGRGSLKFTKEI
jgi:hypothetical protein